MNARRRTDLEPAFLLHHRPYRDTSRILEVLTERHGRLTLFARGARGPRSKLASVLLPFKPLLVAWSGRGDAAQLTAAEANADCPELPAAALLSAFYLNELVLKLTTRHDPQPQLFQDYAAALVGLRSAAPLEPVLRIFEKRLLAALGYGLEFDVEPDAWYRFVPDAGLVATTQSNGALAGESLVALANEALESRAQLEDAKRLLRAALDQCLEGRELSTRAVARAVTRRDATVAERVPKGSLE
jgi:DNA repair protein RecO (recombination protein O)